MDLYIEREHRHQDPQRHKVFLQVKVVCRDLSREGRIQ